MKMATVKYASPSPYVEIKPFHPSDYKLSDYEARLLGPGGGQGEPKVKRVGLALFGTGRQVEEWMLKFLMSFKISEGICSFGQHNWKSACQS